MLEEGIDKGGFGTGRTIMSDSLIACQPRILEPSKPKPSVNESSLISLTGTENAARGPENP